MGNILKKPCKQQQQELQIEEQKQSVKEDGNREFTCEICIEPVPTFDKQFKNADKCSHPFCTDCMVNYIRSKLQDGNDGEIKCPAIGCQHSLEPAACTQLVGPELFVRWCDALCEAAILDTDRCYCPHRDCNEVIVNECGGSVRRSKCPSCKKLFCFKCKRVWHAGFGCDETRDSDDVAFGELVEEKMWMRCPRCRHFVELVDGCKIIRCRCGIDFCYNCGNQVHRHGCDCESLFPDDIMFNRIFWSFIVITIIFCWVVLLLSIILRVAGRI